MATEEGSRAPINITKPKAILAEGKDVKLFFKHACARLHIDDIDVFDFNSNSNLLKYLKMFVATAGFRIVQSLLLARDAEENPKGAWNSAANALEKCGLAKPPEPFVLKKGNPTTGVLIFPGYCDADPGKSLLNGSIEDTCLATVTEDSILNCVDRYLQCITDQGGKPHARKSRLHAYLASKHDYVGLKVGEATKAGAWNLDHPSFSMFKKVLQNM